ncbi:MAG: rRNA maturation RNase YbeY [Chloroflexota bacterium]
MIVTINVLIEGRFRDCPDAAWLRQAAARVLRAEGIGETVEVGLVITGQKQIRELNRTYRGIDAPTDVLSFFMTPENEEMPFVAPPDGTRRLGEVIISCPQAKRQAKSQDHSLLDELAILITHGVLHLLGYDHEKPGDARKMRRREAEILAEGLTAP